jgi:light-harvesting complex I chlorophyll a/b binding protein 1
VILFISFFTKHVFILNNIGFDPAGFSNLIDVRWLREAELKHCRICMLAVVGWVATEFVKLPGDIHNISPIAAHDAAVRWGALAQINILVHLFEIISLKAVVEMFEGSGREPGEFGFDPLNFSKNPKDAAVLAEKELANGRLAMLAFGGIVTQAVLTGKPFPYL